MPEFPEIFGRTPEVSASAPGRVNLLGEHTDYNDGYVLPTVIPLETRVEIARCDGPGFRVYSANYDEMSEFTVDSPPPSGFAAYVLGCVASLRDRGIAVPAAVLRLESAVPIGRGLSSSAALEVAVLRAFRAMLALKLDDKEIAMLAHRAEVEFAGVRCGVMDQMAASVGRPGRLLFLDTRTLESRLVALPAGTELLVLDSGVSRDLSATAYNERRAECERAAEGLGVPALRDVTDVSECRRLPSPLDRRARHVVTENARTLRAGQGVHAREFGALMRRSHASLRDDFEVSVPALDRLVELLAASAHTFGARLTGAGFGGACVALVRRGASDEVAAQVLDDFAAEGFRGQRLI